MRARVLGAAVAACVLTSGAAEASGIYETVRIDTDQGYLFFHSGKLAGFSTDLVGQLTYNDNGGQVDDFSLFSQSGDLSFSLAPNSSGGTDLQLSADATGHTIYIYCDQFACGPVHNDIDIVDLVVATNRTLSYGTSFSISGSEITYTSNFTFLLQDGYDTAFQGDFGTVAEVSVQVIPVPLPCSAPMFGVGLMALGTVGYGLKRKQQVRHVTAQSPSAT